MIQRWLLAVHKFFFLDYKIEHVKKNDVHLVTTVELTLEEIAEIEMRDSIC